MKMHKNFDVIVHKQIFAAQYHDSWNIKPQ